MANKKYEETPIEKTWMYRLKNVRKSTWAIIFVVALVLILGPIVWDIVMPAQGVKEGVVDETQLMVIEDEAGLLTIQEEEQLKEHMKPITEHGGVAFVSCSYNKSSASKYAEKKFREYFGKSSGTVFLIDMDNRKIYIFSDGEIYNTITTQKAEAITDNIYKMASRRQYFQCAAEAYDQIATLLQGGKIPQPMKHICNALLALALALVIVFFIANQRTRIKKDTEEAIFEEGVSKAFTLGSPYKKELLKEKRVRHTESSGGSGGGGHSGGGGGGGGHSSGGGGGHSF